MYIPHCSVWDSLPANCKLPLPWACCHGKVVQISCNPLPWASGKIQSLSLNWLCHDHMLYFASSPWKWVVTTTCQVLVVWLRIHLLPFYQQSTPEWLFTLCISSLLKGAARNKSITRVQLAHSEEHRSQVEEVLTCLLTDLSIEERRRIGKSQCTLESRLVCPCIEVLPIGE